MKIKFLKFNNKKFGPYEYILYKENIGFDTESLVRGAKKISIKNKDNSTEIFLEDKNIFIAIGNIKGKKFLDIFNTLTKNTNRLFLDNLNIIYNTKNFLYINYNLQNEFYTKKYSINNLKEIYTKKSKISVFYKVIYNFENKKYSILELEENRKSFKLKSINDLIEKPLSFNNENMSIYIGEIRTRYGIEKQYYYIALYLINNLINRINDEKYLIGNLIEKIELNKNFMNNQNYINSKKVKGIVRNYTSVLFHKGIINKKYNELKKEVNSQNFFFLYLTFLTLLGFIIIFFKDDIDFLSKIVMLFFIGLILIIFFKLSLNLIINTYFNKNNLKIFIDNDKIYYDL